MTHHSAKLLLGAIDAAIYLAVVLNAPTMCLISLQNAASEIKNSNFPQ
jgi:hypothetical protein